MFLSSSDGTARKLIVLGLWLAALLVAALPGARAGEPRFELPVDCRMGETCSIQNYVDHDGGPGRQDYACGQLSYDGHGGTDFRVPNLPAMERGVGVLAAAPGVVLRTRDGMDDINIREIGRAALKGRDAGNSVIVDHGDGWETQYGHLRKGSVAVEPGERVAAGQVLGLIGLSGNTEFPHVHFAVRLNGETLDPFVGPGGFQGCGGPRQPLWSERALGELAYQATGILSAGFAEGRLESEAARAGRVPVSIDPSSPALVLWVDVFGVEAGDRQRFTIEAPDGRVIHDKESEIEASKVVWFAYSGLKRKAERWPSGVYRGHYGLTRDGAPLVEIERRITVP